MKFWKQLLLSLLILAVALAGWIRLDPDAAAVLARAGVPVPEMLKSPTETASLDRGTGNRGFGRGAGGRNAGGTLVLAATVERGTVNDRFSAIGTGAPVRTVSVQPQVSGQIAAIDVTSGSRVEAGDVLVRLGSESETIARDQARIAVETARQRVERTEKLVAQRTISSVEAEQARTELENAELALRQSELDLDRRTIRAPIAGITGILNVNVGDFVTNQTVLATIDDRDTILVEFFVPERLVGSLQIGAGVTASAVARPGERYEGKITALDNRLDEASRTLRVRAEIPNAEDRLRAGMSFSVRMRFAGETYPSVDPLAIQWDSKGSYVWRITDGKAERVAISIIQRNSEVVLVDAGLAEGDLVVTEGVQSVRPGGDVQIVGQDAPPEEMEKSGATDKTVENDAAAAAKPGEAG